jgi:alkylation response protein AidB-like acyl-CoA dehydrogenase
MTFWEPFFIAVIIAFWVLAYFEVPIWLWSIAFILSVGAVQWAIPLSFTLQVSLWTVLILFVAVFNISILRQKIVTVFLFQKFKKVLPPMSSTEREAIEAGDVWWESHLFRGRVDWHKLHAFPKPALTTEELHFINTQVEQLCEMVEEWPITHTYLDLPPEAWAYLKEQGFFGMIIPKEFGGLGFSALANSTVVQKIASRSLTTAITTMVPNSLGPGELLMHYGTEEQKQYYLPRLAKGIDIPCFALTGADAGSDAGAIPDIGIICRGEFEGQSIIGMKLTWDKRYITLAPVATVLGLAFKLYDPEKLLGGNTSLGITLCLLPTSHPGVEIGKRHFPLNQPFMNGPTRGREVFVPLDWIIGGPKMIGKGWRMLVECLSAGRGISLPAVGTAAAKISYRTTGAYARIRKQFHTSIGHFEGVQASMARMAGLTYLIEACRLFTLTALDQKHRPGVTTAIAKYHITEMSRQVVNDAMDVHGGKAIMLGPKNYLGRVYESLPISITVEGANILTRNLMIFGQGAIRCHPYLQKEINAVNHADPTQGLKLFDENLFKHLRYTLSNAVRSLTHSFTGGYFCGKPFSSPIRKYYRQVSRMAINLSFIADITMMIFGGKLKRRERLSARLGDMLSYLFLASAVIKYYQNSNDKKTDLPHVHWAMQTCLYRFQEAFLEFTRNFSLPVMGFLLRIWVFPFGRAYILPTDALEQRLATLMMEPSIFRDRLTRYCYVGKNQNNPIMDLDLTLSLLLEVEPILAKIELAVKKGKIAKHLSLEEQMQEAIHFEIITQQEAALIFDFEKARRETIQVDEFTSEQLSEK